MEVNSFSIFPTAARGHVIQRVISQPLCFRKQSINSHTHTVDRPLNPSPQIMASGGRRPADLLLVAYQLQNSPLRWSENTHRIHSEKDEMCIKHTKAIYSYKKVVSNGKKQHTNYMPYSLKNKVLYNLHSVHNMHTRIMFCICQDVQNRAHHGY